MNAKELKTAPEVKLTPGNLPVFDAVQFNGKNSSAVAEWSREHGMPAKGGGSYVSLFDSRFENDKFNILKGDWLLFNPQDGMVFAVREVDVEDGHFVPA